MAATLPLARLGGVIQPPRSLPGVCEVRAGVWWGARMAGQLGLLWLILTVGSALTQRVGVPLPGNLGGMLLLLGLLWSGVIRLSWVQELSTILVRHLILFFIPLAVGLMVWENLLATSGVVIGVSLLGSAVVGLVAAGFTAQRLARGEEPAHDR